MRVLKHLSINDEVLTSIKFKRESVMQAYLVENPTVLALPDQNFSDVEIIAEELPVKDGRGTKDTDGRIDLLTQYGNGHFGVVELKNGELTNAHLNQLHDYLQKKEDVLQKIICKDDNENHIEFKDTKWIGILVGTSISDSLKESILEGKTYNYKNSYVDIPIAALTLQRYSNANNSKYVSVETFFKSPTGKDYTKYEFRGEEHGKGRLVLAVLKQFVQENPKITYKNLKDKFPPSLQGSNVFTTEKNAKDIERDKGRSRHFTKLDEAITLLDAEIMVSSQWGLGNIGKFVEHTREHIGYTIKEVKN